MKKPTTTVCAIRMHKSAQLCTAKNRHNAVLCCADDDDDDDDDAIDDA